MSGWLAIFKTGTHTDAGGHTREWTRADLDQIVTNYNPAQHEAPAVIGHPQTDDPAWAWVEGLRRTGDVLYAKLKDVVPEFGEMVRKGLFKKRSIALFPSHDGRWSLRHIGFLGATPPAIKGLEDRLAFTAAAAPAGLTTLEFQAWDDQDRSRLGRILTGLREWIIDRSGLEEADRVLPSWDIHALVNPPTAEAPAMADPHTPSPVQEIEMDAQELERRLQQAREEGRQAAAHTFAAQQQANDARLAQLEADHRRQRLQGFLADLKRQGILLPAWEKAGLVAFMESLETATWPQTLTLTFSAGDGTQQTALNPAAWFQQFLAAMPQAVVFGEWATHEGDEGAEDAGERLVELTHQYMKDHADLSFSEAFTAVQRAQPDLAAAHLADQRAQQPRH